MIAECASARGLILRPFYGIIRHSLKVASFFTMDIDTICYLVHQELYRTTLEFERRLTERDITLQQVFQAIESGRIVRRERGKRGGLPKCTIRGFVSTDADGKLIPVPVELEVACAVEDEVIFITVYWVKNTHTISRR